MTKYKNGIIIGRFQPVHNGHIEMFKYALSIAENLTIVIGSSDLPSTPKNPFTAKERMDFIAEAMGSLGSSSRIGLVSVIDYKYSDEKWANSVVQAVSPFLLSSRKKDTCLIGHKKDESSWYLDMFPQWYYEDFEGYCDISASDIRESVYMDKGLRFIGDLVPPNVKEYLSAWKGYKTLAAQYKIDEAYREDVVQYPRIEQTADAVVVQSGHILLIIRRDNGLWALPGGFVNPKETVLQTAVRELREETGLDVPVKTIYANIQDRQGTRFDHPDRDPRTRIITTAFLVHLPIQPSLTKFKAGDDAAGACWIPLSDIADMRLTLYADHFDIIKKLTSGL